MMFLNATAFIACVFAFAASSALAADCYGNDSELTTISGTYKYGEQGGPWLRLDQPVLACNGTGEISLVKLWGDWVALPQGQHAELRGKRLMDGDLAIFEVSKDGPSVAPQGHLSPAECDLR
jgi:hypothetical protein